MPPQPPGRILGEIVRSLPKEFFTSFAEAQRMLAANQPEEAEAKLRHLLHQAQASKRADAEVIAQAAFADISLKRGLEGLAVGDMEAALDRAQQSRDSRLQFFALLQLAGLREELGDLNAAEGLYGQALASARSSRSHHIESVALGSLGVIEAKRGRTDKSIELLKQSLVVSDSNDDLEASLITSIHLADQLAKKGAKDEAFRLLHEARVMAAHVGNYAAEIDILENLGGIKLHFGDVEEARTLWETALALAQTLRDEEAESRLRARLSGALSYLGHHTRAEKMVAEAMQSGEDTHDNDNSPAKAYQLLSMAGVLLSARRARDAAAMYREAIHIFRLRGLSDVAVAETASLASALNVAGRYGESLMAAQSVIEAYEHRLPESPLAIAHAVLGVIYRKLGNPAKAEEQLRLARSTFRALGDTDNLWRTCGSLGKCLAKKGDYRAASESYSEGIQVLENMRGAMQHEENLRELWRDRVALYQEAALVAFHEGQFRRSWEIAEMAKTRYLADLIVLRMRGLKTLPPGLQSDLKFWRDEVRKRRQALSEARLEDRDPSDPSAYAPVVDKEVRLNEAIWRLHTEEEKAHVILAHSQQQERVPVPSLEETLKCLCSPGMLDGALLEFLICEGGTLVYTATLQERDGIPESALSVRWVEDLPDSTALRQEWLASYRRFQDNQDSSVAAKGWADTISAVCAMLSDLLFSDVYPRLRTCNIRRLLVVPHRWLHLVPFNALPVASDGGKRHLIDEFEICNAPSATIWFRCRTQVAAPLLHRASLLIAAVPEPLGQDPLSYAVAEASGIASRFPDRATLLIGDQASKTALRHTMRDWSGLVHLTCHGVFREEDPLDSHLSLAGDESLTLREVFGEWNLEHIGLVCLRAYPNSAFVDR